MDEEFAADDLFLNLSAFSARRLFDPRSTFSWWRCSFSSCSRVRCWFQTLCRTEEDDDEDEEDWEEEVGEEEVGEEEVGSGGLLFNGLNDTAEPIGKERRG